MVQNIDPKQNYYVARDNRFKMEAQRNDYMSQFGKSDVFSQAQFDKYGDALKEAQKNEFFSECDFDNENAKTFDACITKMMYPGLNFG